MVTHQLQVERRTGKVRRSKTDVLPTVPHNQPSEMLCIDAGDSMMTCKHFSLLDEEYITSLHTFYGTGRPFVVCRLSSICLSDRPSVVCNVCAPCSKGRSFRQYFCIIIAQGLGQFVLKFWAKIRRASSGSCKLNRRGYEKLPAATSESMHLSTSTVLGSN